MLSLKFISWKQSTPRTDYSHLSLPPLNTPFPWIKKPPLQEGGEHGDEVSITQTGLILTL